MPTVVHLRSALFDPASEPDNPINPIPGLCLLDWLRARLPADVTTSAPDAEDWGWYSDVVWRGRKYLVGAGANEDEDGGRNHEWMLQVDKMRSFKERLLGREKMSSDDAFLAVLLDLVRNEPSFTDIEVEHGS